MGLIISGAMMVSPLLYSPAYAAEDEPQLNIEDADYYYVKSYKSGDCVLCANAYMLMRAAFDEGSLFFDGITNKKLRKHACTSSGGNILKHEYTYTFDGLTFTVKYKKLSGDYSERKAKIKKMLKKHPEGIVGLGYSKYGTHGVLLTEFKDSKFYAADSALNYGSFNEGITPYSETIMKSLKTVKHVWYLKEVTGTPTTAHVKDMEMGIRVKKSGDQWKLTWYKKGDDTPLDGFKVGYIGKSAFKRGENFKPLLKTRLHYTMVDDKKNGKSYYYRVRGYVKDVKDGKTRYVFTNSAKVLVEMSEKED
ncbi:MAG: hypothetical protein II918_05950 [Firmicutes bacterium]|nr:hypothetical protein [Bacillota bacterium]